MNLSDSPRRPACSSRASGWSSLTTPWGLPCCVRFPCVHAVATTPAQRLGVLLRSIPQPYQPSPKGSSGRPAHRPFRDAMGRGGEENASIVADVTDGGPNAKAERPEPIPYRPEAGKHTDRSDRNEFAELARCRHRAWCRASTVEEACGRRERIAEAAQSLA